MKRLSLHELVILCSPLLLLGAVGYLLSRRDPLDVSRVSLRLSVGPPTNMETLDGSGAAFSIAFQGPQASRWKILSASSHLQLETPNGEIQSDFPWSYLWMHQVAITRTVADLTRVPHGKLRYVCEAYIVPEESPNDKPKRLIQSWPLNRAVLIPPWAQKPRQLALGLSKFTITRIGNLMWNGKKGRDITGELEFVVGKGARATLDAMPLASPFEMKYSVSPPLNAQKNGVPLPHQSFSIELTNSFVAARRLKNLVRISGRASTGGCWPLAFQVEPFDFSKVQVGEQFKVKSCPVPRPTP